MNDYTVSMAQRVPGACREEKGQDFASSLPGLILQELSDAESYLYLGRILPGPESIRLRELARQEQSHGACLRGISTLITGQPAESPVLPPEPGQPVAVLRSCYGNTMRRLARYEQYRVHPEYGPVFGKLAMQEQEHCREILELIGRISRT